MEVGYDGLVLILFRDEDGMCFIPGDGSCLTICDLVEGCCQDGCKDEFEVFIESIGKAIWAWG